jgi:hypothetical protein
MRPTNWNENGVCVVATCDERDVGVGDRRLSASAYSRQVRDDAAASRSSL